MKTLKITEDTTVPLGWMFGGFAIIITGVSVGAMWVKSVDLRLERIEEKLSIPHYSESDLIINNAYGSVK